MELCPLNWGKKTLTLKQQKATESSMKAVSNQAKQGKGGKERDGGVSLCYLCIM